MTGPSTRAGRPGSSSDDGTVDTDRSHVSLGETLARGFESSDDSPRAVAVESSASFDPATRYVVERKLGEGGMGEIRLCADSFVGRNVAMKVSSLTHTTARARFLREARVQGQLEHPAVVPVYDIGTDGTNNVFFTMKRIVGRTLEEILHGLRDGDPDLIAKFPQRRLLQAMSQIALALEFAHQRGVVHRDLKPANVMIGDFGEVYVLDWGIAKVAGLDGLADDSIKIEQTSEGAILGTPGYLSPEQAQGLSNQCDARVDVYALGLMLYEILTHERVHAGKGIGILLASTLQLDGARPRKKRAGISAELDDLCYEATRLDPSERVASARAMHDHLERFLDGERDRERRNAQAEQHAARADIMLMKLSSDPVAAEAARAAAMRELGAALALSPGHARAQQALLDVLLSEPDAMPVKAKKEVEQRLQVVRADSARKRARIVAVLLAMIPLMFWMGVRSVPFIATFVIASVTNAVVQFLASRGTKAKRWHLYAVIATSCAYISSQASMFGPFVYVPQTATLMAAYYMVGLRADRQLRVGITFASAATFIVPVLLMIAHVIPSPYTFENDTIVIHPIAVHFTRPVPTILLAIVSSLAVIFGINNLVGSSIESLIDVERRAVARSHRMRQLLPVLEDSARHRI